MVSKAPTKVTKEYRKNYDDVFKKKQKCKDGKCVYSRSMNQEYPRACIKCGCKEKQK